MSNVFAAVFRAQPSALFRRHKYFYWMYDSAWVVICAALIALMEASGWRGLGIDWGLGLIGVFVAFVYIQILGSVFIHNCAHINWPRNLNRLVGEISGAIVMTRYASWEILHRRHHAFSDDTDKDPHYIIKGGFWRFFVKIMVINLEQNLHQQFLELWGETPENRRLEAARSVYSVLVMLVLAYTWYAFLGAPVFFAAFVPAAFIGAVHISHFNWATHDGTNPEGDFKPINLDSGMYWLGNRLCFGLYFHKNHHERASLFNPMHLDRFLADKAERKASREGVADPN